MAGREENVPVPLFIKSGELSSWSFWRNGIAEFIATFLFLYITILTVMGFSKSPNNCSNTVGVAWAFGGMIFVLVYCTSTISGGHINPAVTFSQFLARKITLTQTIFYIVMQCLGAIGGAGVVKSFGPSVYETNGGGANVVNRGYTKGNALGAEIIGTFVLVYTVFSATEAKSKAKDPNVSVSVSNPRSKSKDFPNVSVSATDAKSKAKDPNVSVLAPLAIGFAVFLVHLATIPITGTGINPARSLGAAIIYNKDQAWDDHWIFWVGPFIGATLATLYHQVIIRAIPFQHGN